MTTPNLENLTVQKRVSRDAGLLPVDLSTLARVNPTSPIVSDILPLGVVNYLGEQHSASVGYLSPISPTPSNRLTIVIILTNLSTSDATFLTPWSISNSSPVRGARFLEDDVVQTNNLANGTHCSKTGIWYGRVGDVLYVRVRHFTNAIFSLQYEYDVRIRQDGKIDFGYAPLDVISRGDPEAPDPDELVVVGTLNNPLGIAIQNSAQPLTARDQEYGGQLYPIVSAVYASRSDWPAPIGMGATYTLSSPKETRKILPRLQVRKDDSEARIDGFGLFDDVQSAAFVEQPVNFPTTLPRLFAQNSTKGPPDVDLYTDMELTTGINPSSFGDWLPRRQEAIGAFSEVGLYDQDHKYDGYYSGTLASDVGTDGFSGWLGQKDRIVLEYDIEFPTQLDPYKASLLYFDTKSQTFKEVGEKTDPLTTFEVHGDAKLFTAFGTMVMSGGYAYPGGVYDKYVDHYYNDSTSPPILTQSTAPFTMSNPWSYGYFTQDRVNKSFQHTLIESPTIGKKYSFDTNDISPIQMQFQGDRDFLVERVVIEMPFEAGPKWLNDKTISNVYMYNYYELVGPVPYDIYSLTETIDVGGPCVTVGLIKETKNKKITNNLGSFDQNYSLLRRDVICSGTLIPPEDNIATFVKETYEVDKSVNSSYEIEWVANVGYKAHVGKPTAVLSYPTGSVKFEMKPGFSNLLYYSYGINDLPYFLGGPGQSGNDSITTNPVDAYGYGKEYLDLSSGRARIHGSKPHGSSMAGPADQHWFSPSRQMEPPAKLVVDGRQSLYAKNIAYTFAESLSSSLSSNTFPTYYAQSGFVGNFIDNPYLLSPGDALTVFVSKFRKAKTPADGFGQPEDFSTTPSYNVYDIMHSYKVSLFDAESIGVGHDIKVSSGKLKVTLYGSYVGEGKEKHPISSLDSTTAASVAIGEEPVLDQFELTSPQDRLGTFYDNFLAERYVSPAETPADVPAATRLLNRKRITGAAYGVNHYTNTDSVGKLLLVPGSSSPGISVDPGNLSNYYLEKGLGILEAASIVANGGVDVLLPLSYWSNLDRRLALGAGSPGAFQKMFLNEATEDSLQLDMGKGGLRGKIGYSSYNNITFTSDTLDATTFPSLDIVNLYTGEGANFISSFPYEYGISNQVDRVLTNDASDVALLTYSNQFLVEAFGTTVSGVKSPRNISKGDLARAMFGFGSEPGVRRLGYDGGSWTVTTPAPAIVDVRLGPDIRGWRYGMNLGVSNPSCVFSVRHYGHLRDMLEQRQVTATVEVPLQASGDLSKDDLNYAVPWGSKTSAYNAQKALTKTEAAVEVKFLIRDTDGKYLKAKPEETSSGNMDVFYRSYAPFIEGQTRDRDYSTYPLLDLSYIVVSP